LNFHSVTGIEGQCTSPDGYPQDLPEDISGGTDCAGGSAGPGHFGDEPPDRRLINADDRPVGKERLDMG